MDRVHEQRLDRNYRYQRHVYDLTREYYLLGRDTLISGLVPPEKGSILEIGCGTARNLIKAAEQYPYAHLLGIDLSRAMLETARQKLEGRGLGGRVHLAHADVTSFDPLMLFGRRSFDCIFFSYALSMIPPWQEALARSVDFLAPGGSLHVVDFGVGNGLPSVANAALRAWLARFHVTPRDGLEPYLHRLVAERRADLFVTLLYRGYTIYSVLTTR